MGIVIGFGYCYGYDWDGTTANVTANIDKTWKQYAKCLSWTRKRGAPRDDNSAKPFKDWRDNCYKKWSCKFKRVSE